MPWKLGDTIIKEGNAWSTADTQHPSNWAIWSDAEKKDKGLVWEDPPASYDERFYWSAGVEKRLTDSSDGTIGLKSKYINQTKNTANALLQHSDWYITRKMEDSTKAIPSDISTYRSDVRTSCANIEAKINAANDMATFIKLFDSALDSNGITTINNWPEPVPKAPKV